MTKNTKGTYVVRLSKVVVVAQIPTSRVAKNREIGSSTHYLLVVVHHGSVVPMKVVMQCYVYACVTQTESI